MAHKHGLGRGLSSLIPQKKTAKTVSQKTPTVSERTPSQKKPIASQQIYRKGAPVGDMPAPKTSPSQQNISVSKGEQGTAVINVPLAHIHPNSQQPRMYFDEDKLKELARSIKEHGILQPLVVLQKDDAYELIAGERRLRAAQLAGLTTVPVIVRAHMAEQKKLELALIENVQRHDLNVIEEAKSYKKLIVAFNLSQDDIATRTGKSRSAIANRMRLLQLPVEVQRGLIEGKITEGHAKVILSVESTEKQHALYQAIISGGLSVREAEKTLRKTAHVVGTQVAKHTRGEKNPQERILEEQLAAYFGTKVHVKSKGTGGGEIKITYFSQEELRTILEKLKF